MSSQILIVMTDGVQTIAEGDPRTSGDILSAAVAPIKEKGVEVISIGIGKGIVLMDLVTLASDDTGVFLAESFEALDQIVTDVREGKCPGEIGLVPLLSHDHAHTVLLSPQPPSPPLSTLCLPILRIVICIK